MHEDSKMTRRSFFKKLWIGLGIVALVEFLGIGFAFFRPRKPKAQKGSFGDIITAGTINQFVLNSVTAFREGQFYLVRMQDGGFLAVSRKCTHLGCTVPWIEKEKKFKCPCHASAFDITGNVINPPAPRSLDIYAIKIENQIIKVDTSKLIRRKRFSISQVVYPS